MKFLTKRKAIWSAALAVFILIVVLLSGRKPVPVKVVEIEPGELLVVVNATTTSTIRSEREAVLSAQRTGRVVELPVREGDRVKTGQLICRLDLTEESVQSEKVLAQSKAQFEEAEKSLTRIRSLFTRGMVARQDLDTAQKVFEIARSQYEAAKADAGVKQAYSVIRSPFSGIIATKSTEVGELLLPGKQIVTIVDPDRIYVLASIDEVDVGRLKLGQFVKITVDAFPGELFSGTVKRVSPIVSGGKLETRTADVWIYFTKRDVRLKPGMSADIEILIARFQNVLSVPSQAVVERDGKKQVFVAEGKSLGPGSSALALLKTVELGETNWTYTEIRGGISPGVRVITTPEAEGLKNGVRVKIERE